MLSLRVYLTDIHVAAHRKAYTRLITSCHRLGVEVLRWKVRYRDVIPREWRLCRFCYEQCEDEAHALLGCHINPELNHCRETFFNDASTLFPDFDGFTDDLSLSELLQWLVEMGDGDFRRRFARFVHDVFVIFAEKPVYVPPSHFYK